MLTFNELRKANLARVIVFRNGKGELSHGETGVMSWTPAEWACAMAGEAGETCNAVKKLFRGDFYGGSEGDAQIAKIGEEIADTVIYADLLAARLEINLGNAVAHKFNRVSERVGADVWLPDAARIRAIASMLVALFPDDSYVDEIMSIAAKIAAL